MTPAYQTAQVAHAALDFPWRYPTEYCEWQRNSASLITLAVKTERELFDFAKKLESKGQRVVRFYEPDIGYALTSFAIVPGPQVKKLCSNLPLALKNPNNDHLENERRIKQIVHDMNNCFQFETQNILDHGISVKNYAFDLLAHLREGTPLKNEWKLPAWVYEHKDLILSSLTDDYTLEKYLIFHDLGKPYCRTVDENGKQHFPNHAEVSYQTWLSISDDHKIADLIRMDMDIHTLKASGVSEFAKKPQWATLLIAGLSEIHSNAPMFGGLESTGFKMKWKNFDRFGKRICEENNVSSNNLRQPNSKRPTIQLSSSQELL